MDMVKANTIWLVRTTVGMSPGWPEDWMVADTAAEATERWRALRNVPNRILVSAIPVRMA